MKKLFTLLVFVLPMLAGCGAVAQFEIYNGCPGSHMVIKANGQVRADNLNYGGSFTLDVSHFGSGEILLSADGFSNKDNSPLGTATYGPIFLNNSGNDITGPKQASWQITGLNGGPPGACQNR